MDTVAHTSLAESHCSFGKSLWTVLACSDTFIRYARSYASRGVRRPKAYKNSRSSKCTDASATHPLHFR